jgi:REP element-mobilizing transposase RayT
MEVEMPFDSSIQKRYGAYLPHWTRDGAWYAVTFRLWDSIPKPILDFWRNERENIIKTAKQMNRLFGRHELERLNYLYSEKIECYLDRGAGSCYMKDNRIAKLVADAVTHFESQRYDLAAWCVMPNHVHAVLNPRTSHKLSEILHSWKSFTAKEANKLLKRQGSFWQTEPYDHLIRDRADFLHAVRYVLANPRKANLSNWPWVGIGESLAKRENEWGRT